MKYLITGGLGFIGSNIATLLSHNNQEVVILDNLDPMYGGNPFNINDAAQNNLRIVNGSVLDEKLLVELIADVDFVIHTAAQVSYIDSLKLYKKEIDLNINSTINVLNAIKQTNRSIKILFTSSRMVYGKTIEENIDENTAPSPVSLYGTTKLTSENIIKIYNKKYNIPFIILRITNPYGMRQQIKHSKYSIVGWFIRQAIENNEIKIFGDGKQNRNYIFSEDITKIIYRLILDDRSVNNIFNLGSDKNCEFREMIDCIISIVGSGKIKYVDWPENYENVETKSFNVSIDKLKNNIGNFDFTRLDIGIRRTIEYYKKYWNQYV